MKFIEKYKKIVRKNNSVLCVGLDSDIGKLPDKYKNKQYPQFAFNKCIIDQTHDLVCAYKPNSAFYEAKGVEGMAELKMTVDYLKSKYPDIVTILDAKRADIGNTNKGYVEYIFDYLGFDGVTVNPYLGQEALEPFLDRQDKGIIVLCKTSNPGSGEFQDLRTDKKKLYQVVAENVVNDWNKNSNCLLVVGATYPAELTKIRKIAGDMVFLIPGVGEQGGDVEKTVKAGINSTGDGVIINLARKIIFADNPRETATKLRDEINVYR
ncbi:orotidine-5'-phosphate decarboxylase [Candidatus Roizmanbacteria bacterium CG22_combo_CG10-13_8_21_14_all_38_20]|uniref:Orotidine-5'-phosphate decarboxylase n=1 Tax=Candidatus Roizmanbacteria bacterium CG22_combo_CG10-13_8_21_14_all_38_20 TaxID=1974862 RepID=A0A2H0BUM8_9BACT|nr:orotidine-5'-phosphate decarboxylase [Candidatus Microgenomates bacterium]PIP61387.1 MAG: orotidine-5'-phosphate decarboxylase [Candidatus Roizmanbacteria bacterium CG22_combo_CG10-13_8_21_14_all_38_20]PJC31558.1 MAG: orotidine-5'-phosphate decarboxylase [Candidatus Roizmanbacteria bacterium CG_4_9_14_0_2_um_filter_38_17]